MSHNINQSLPWIVAEPHARLHGMADGTVVATRHHTPVTRFATESEAMAYLTKRNAADERSARLGSVNPSRNNRRYVAYSTATYADIMRVHHEQQAIDTLVNNVIAMTR